MSSDFFNAIERMVEKQQTAYIKQLMYYYGSTCKAAEVKSDVYSDVYGARNTGASEDYTLEFKGLFIVERYDSSYDGGHLYTFLDREIKPGTILKIERSDIQNRRYSVDNVKYFGLTNTVFYRYVINSVGD